MFFRDLKPASDTALVPGSAILRLPIRIGSRDPETAIIRPVKKRLERHDAAKVVSWRIWTRGEGEVRGVELKLELTQPTRAGLVQVAESLRSAPLGSSVRFCSGGEPLVFGGSVAIEVDLPPIDPATSQMATRCADALGPAGRIRGWQIGAHATRLYIYGPEARAIVSRIQPVIGDCDSRPVT